MSLERECWRFWLLSKGRLLFFFLLFFSIVVAFESGERSIETIIVFLLFLLLLALLLFLLFLFGGDTNGVGHAPRAILTHLLGLVHHELVANVELVAVPEAAEKLGLVVECIG